LNSYNDSNNLFHAFFTLTWPSAYYIVVYYRNACTLGTIYWYRKTQYHCSFSFWL